MFVASYEYAGHVAQGERGFNNAQGGGAQHDAMELRAPSLHFPWRIAGDYLIALKCERNRRASSATYVYSASELRKMLLGART